MRVICNNLDEFISNLKLEPSSSFLQRIVRVSVTERPLDSSSKRDAVKFSINFQASAIVCLEDGGQYLLDFGEDCGLDYRDSSNEPAGTKRAGELRAKLSEFCDDYGLGIRPGIIEV